LCSGSRCSRRGSEVTSRRVAVVVVVAMVLKLVVVAVA